MKLFSRLLSRFFPQRKDWDVGTEELEWALWPGDAVEEVRTLQNLLREFLGIDLPVTGVFCEHTEAAVDRAYRKMALNCQGRPKVNRFFMKLLRELSEQSVCDP